MRKPESCAKVQYGSIYSINGCIIENPALLIDEASGVLLSWGEKNLVEAKYQALLAGYNQIGMDTTDIVFLAMNNFAFTREEQCYIIRRCVEYTASGFQTRVCQIAKSGQDPRAWLAEEMARVPIDVTQ